jgi:hypothetical protein
MGAISKNHYISAKCEENLKNLKLPYWDIQGPGGK